MTYDPGWDMPRPNWLPQGSFEVGIIPLTVAPDDAPTVCLPPINVHWLPLVLGCLDQLRNPSTWLAADDNAMFAVLSKANRLMQMLGERGDCGTMMIRLQSCQLQTSIDGGVTWVTVTGWDPGFAECVQEQIPVIGLPPNPGDETHNGLACSIANYLANELILASLNAAVTAINDDITLLGFGATILSIIPEFILVRLAYDAFAIIFTEVQSGTIADYEAAIADASLWLQVTCAIYTAIQSAGLVTPTNFPAIITNIRAISYAHSDVITTIADYVEKLGATGLAQVSQRAGLNEGADCSTCVGGWCYVWDGPLNEGDFTTWSFLDGGVPAGQWVPGTGFVSFPFGGGETQILFFTQNWGFETQIDSVTVTYDCPSEAGEGTRQVSLDTASDALNRPAGSGTQTVGFGINSESMTVELDSARTATGHGPNIISRLVVSGRGVNPFGTSNC